MSGAPDQPAQSVSSPRRPKGRWGGLRPIGDFRQGLGISGPPFGISGTDRLSLFYSFTATAVLVGVFNTVNVITVTHAEPQLGLAAPIIWEGSSWATLLLFFWIPWIAWRLAPLGARPRWRLLLHLPAATLFSLCHVEGFVLLRKLAYWLAGSRYEFGPFLPNFLYEFRKDALGYVLFIAGFAVIGHLLRQRETASEGPATFDIRDGAKLVRVAFADILAVSSAGNYVEFVLRDGRKPLMRSPLSALEAELSPRGFVRTHRSWLVNASAVSGLKPEGSGDYAVELGTLTVPLSRRFPEALARLRG